MPTCAFDTILGLVVIEPFRTFANPVYSCNEYRKRFEGLLICTKQKEKHGMQWKN